MAPALPAHAFAASTAREDFDGLRLPLAFQWLRSPWPDELFSLTARPATCVSTVARRSAACSARRSSRGASRRTATAPATVVEFEPQHFQQMAGLVCYYNGSKFHYLYVSHDETVGKHLRVMTCLPDQVQSDVFTPPIAIPGGRRVHLRVEVDYERLRFGYQVEGSEWHWLPQQFDASILSDEATAPGLPNFTGAFVGMACQDLAGTGMPADFDYFDYQERDFRARIERPERMTTTRRDFVSTGLAGAAGVYASRAMALDLSPETRQTPSEDGYRLWLRFAPPGDAAARYRQTLRQIVVEGTSGTARIIRDELTAGTTAMLGAAIPVVPQGVADGALVVGTPKNSAAIRGLGWEADLAKAGPEGYLIRAARIGNRPVIAIASDGEIGALYGAYHFLRLMQTGQPIDRLEHHGAAEGAAPDAQSLGQPGRLDRARLRGPIALAVERAARDAQPPIRRLRARERVDRHQRRGHQQRQRQRAHPHAGLPREGRRARRRCGVRTASACTCRPTSPRRSASVA